MSNTNDLCIPGLECKNTHDYLGGEFLVSCIKIFHSFKSKVNDNVSGFVAILKEFISEKKKKSLSSILISDKYYFSLVTSEGA